MIESAVSGHVSPSSADDGLSFLDAKRTLSQFTGGPPLEFLFAMAGTADPFSVYLDAACAKRGRTAAAHFLPFGTLGQFLTRGDSQQWPEVFLLLPWDLAPELDWRSGVPPDRADHADILAGAERLAAALTRRGARILYVPAPTPPVSGHPADDAALQLQLEAIAASCGATMLPASAFSLGGYFASGCAVGGAWLGRVATRVVDAILTGLSAPAKLLVTDLDNTLWGGVLAEVGAEGIAYDQAGAGYRHYLYQSLLLRLRREGTLLAAVTRNDHAIVDPVLSQDAMTLGADDFVAVYASYNAKSSQIRDLAKRLNLSLDSIVFVDDNAVELQEVRSALPDVRVVAFPARDDALPAFLNHLAGEFGQRNVTAEDRDRTEMYRRRAESVAPSTAKGADLTEFLASLEMELSLHDRTRGNRARAVQLINKTNQFNANGRRWTDEEVETLLASGGRLITASLSDRTGSHGEIAACLIDSAGVIEALVLSCRVFQRRVEHAFMASLAEDGAPPVAIRFAPTARNEPFRQFAADAALTTADEGMLVFDAPQWAERHRSDLTLFNVRWAS